MFDWFKRKEVAKPVYVNGCGLICPRDKRCAKWVIMYQKVKNEDGTIKTIEDGRCCYAWLPPLLIEQTTRIIEAINGNKA